MKPQAMYNSDIIAIRKNKRDNLIFAVVCVPIILLISTVDYWVNMLLM